MKKALLIGINYIGTDSMLRGCVNDCMRFKQFLINEQKFNEDDIEFMNEFTHDKSKIPTKQNIINEIRKLADYFQDMEVEEKRPKSKKQKKELMPMNVSSESSLTMSATLTSMTSTQYHSVYLQYSGHGGNQKDGNGDESDHKDETLVPLDYETSGMISDDEIRSLLIDRLPSNVKLFCIVDACHSGTILDLKYNCLTKITPDNASYNLTASVNYKPSNCSVICFSGCRDNQTSADTEEVNDETGKKEPAGALTWAFLKSYTILKEKEKKIVYKNIIKNIAILLKKNGYEQIPCLSSGKAINIYDTLFSI